MSPRRRRTLLTTGLLAVLLLAAVAVSAQRFGGFGSFREGTFPTLWAPPAMPEASFTFCRLAYRSVRFEQSGIGWQTDYPYAEINLMTRLSELTKTRIGRDDSQTPRHYVVRLTDDTLFNCPFLMASDAGTIGFSDTEVERLRTYLMKGGFFWVDDYWGTAAWNQFESQIARCFRRRVPDRGRHARRPDDALGVLTQPRAADLELPVLAPLGRAHLGARRDSDVVHLRVIRDAKRQVMVVMTHNTDIADSWEREGETRLRSTSSRPTATRSASTCRFPRDALTWVIVGLWLRT
jgi:hypothetical protein